MKRFIIPVILLLTIIFILPACSKKKGCMDPLSNNYDPDAEKDDGSCEYPGTGGNTTIVAYPKLNGAAIISDSDYVDTAFIAFNATSAPMTYDLILPGEEGEDHVHIEGLKKGKYYITMTGRDSLGNRVLGSVAYTLSQSSGEVDLDVPVH
jgi:hypothetical protein